MENASKALLIAGSILIVILLIAMGVRIFNSTTGTTDAVEGTMQTTEVAMFNNKFLQYIGANKSKNDALNLVNMIIANNSTNNIKITLSIYYGTGGSYTSCSDISRLQTEQNKISRLNASRKFVIWIKKYSANGYIEEIEMY